MRSTSDKGKESLTNHLSRAERGALRALATQYGELADSHRNRSALERWRRLNNMQSRRPLVLCNTFHLAPEVDKVLPEQKMSEGPLRDVERWFQRAIWASEIDDDRYLDPWFTVRAGMKTEPEGIFGISPDCIEDSASRGWRHLPVLKKMADLEALRATEHEVIDPDPPLARVLEDVFGDILPVHRNRVSIYHIWDGVIGPAAGSLFGLEELMYALYEAPDMVHRLMAFASQAIIKNFKQCEAAGDWSTADYWYYNTPPHCDDLPDPQPGVYGARLKDLPGFCHSQEFEAVSPAMFEEFLFNYQRPILDLFGRVTYGCCDTLDTKLEILGRMQNLSKITVGPLADPSCYPEPFGDRAVISYRPLPSLMASGSFDEEALRRQLRGGLETLRGCQVELHLHDLMTVRNDITRIFKWAQIAREEAERVAR